MRTTITINDKVYQALKIKAAESGHSISSFVEDAIKFQILEDEEDLKDITSRENEEVLSFDDLVKAFKAEGLL